MSRRVNTGTMKPILGSKISILLRRLTGDSIFLTVSLDDTVLDVKKLLEQKTGCIPSEMTLIYEGKVLMNELTLRHYNITSNAIIHFLLKLRGGDSSGLATEECASGMSNQGPQMEVQSGLPGATSKVETQGGQAGDSPTVEMLEGLSGMESPTETESGLTDMGSLLELGGGLIDVASLIEIGNHQVGMESRIEMVSGLAGITSTSAKETQKWPQSDVPAEERSCHCVRQELQEVRPEKDPDVLTEQTVYKAYLPGPGIFQCSETGLAFEVESGASIVYSHDTWTMHLKEADQKVWVPVGPLFNIWALPGTVRAVYLPHFVCLEDVDISGCSIAHFESQQMTIQKPTKVMAFSAVLENPSFSLLGVVWRKLRSTISLPMHSLVLIFHQLSAANTTLHLYLIPDDISVKQAIEKQETSWNSKLIPKPPPFSPLFFGYRYQVSSNIRVKISPEPHLPFCYRSPKEQQFFVEIYIRNMAEEIEFLITDRHSDTVVWRASLRSGDFILTRRVSKISSGAEFMKKHRTELCSRMGQLSSILENLRVEDVINSEEEEEVKAQNTKQKKNRFLLNLAEKKGPKAQEKLYKVLQSKDPFLVEDLENS